MATITKFGCPQCQTVLQLAGPVPAGKMVKCPKCGASFAASATTAPVNRLANGENGFNWDNGADEEDTSPSPKKPKGKKFRKKKKQESSKALVWGLLIGLVVLLVGGGVGLTIFLMSGKEKKEEVAANNNRPAPAPARNAPAGNVPQVNEEPKEAAANDAPAAQDPPPAQEPPPAQNPPPAQVPPANPEAAVPDNPLAGGAIGGPTPVKPPNLGANLGGGGAGAGNDAAQGAPAQGQKPPAARKGLATPEAGQVGGKPPAAGQVGAKPGVKPGPLGANNPPADEGAAVGEGNEGLEVGNVAPEIQGQDSAGKEFKLTDYRGKVVLLDFWGFW